MKRLFLAALLANFVFAVPADAAPCAPDPGFPEAPGVWHGQRCVNHGLPAEVQRNDRLARKILPNEARYEVRQWANGNYPMPGTVPFMSPKDGNWLPGIMNAQINAKRCVSMGGADHRCSTNWVMQHVDGSCWRFDGIVTGFLHNNGNLQVYVSWIWLHYRVDRSGREHPPHPVPCNGQRVISAARSLASASSARHLSGSHRRQLARKARRFARRHGHAPTGRVEVRFTSSLPNGDHFADVFVNTSNGTGQCAAGAEYHHDLGRVAGVVWSRGPGGDSAVYCGARP